MRYRNVVGIMKMHTVQPNGSSVETNSLEQGRSSWICQWWRLGKSKKDLSSSGNQTSRAHQSGSSNHSRSTNRRTSQGESEPWWKCWNRSARNKKNNGGCANQNSSGSQPVATNQEGASSEWRWWSWTVLGSTLVRAVATGEVIKLLGDGEIGGATDS